MNITIRNIDKKDYAAIQRFASRGMCFNVYTENRFELFFYAKYFWYLELNRATQVLAAYMDGRLAGVLLADMNGEPKASVSLWRKLYVKLAELVMGIGYKGAADEYDAANDEMLAQYKAEYQPDGELNFLAVDPDINGKGIGSQLLDELARREKGKLIYLFTNTGCTYEFYDRRGFERPYTRQIDILMRGKKIPHECFLYSKRL